MRKSPMKNFISPHTHCETALSGSTIDALVNRAKTLEREYFSYTDHNYFSGLYKAYNAADKAGMGFVPGIELYFFDDSCKFIQNTDSQFFKYFKTTVYFKDQEAFRAVSKICSNKRPEITIKDESQKLYNWTDLEEMAKYNIVIVTSDYQDIVAKNIIVGNKAGAFNSYKKLRELVGPENFYVSIMPHKVSKFWQKKVRVKLENGQTWLLDTIDKVTSNSFKNVKPVELSTHPNKHHFVKDITINGIFYTTNSSVISAKVVEDFFPIGSDIQLRANKLMYALASKFGDNVLISDYAYFAEEGDKVVQSMKLDNSKLSADYNMLDNEAAIAYFTDTMGLTIGKVEELIANSFSFAKQFDNFKLEYGYRLPKHDGDSMDTIKKMIKETGRSGLLKDPIYKERLKYELDVLKNNGKIDLLPYFFPIRKVLDYYKQQGRVTGPARGSAAGSLLMYLIGITQLDPLEYDLPFDRFFSLDRLNNNDLPDVDVDLDDRSILTNDGGLLDQLFGDKWGQVSTRNLLKIKSAIKDVNRYKNGKVLPEIEALTKALPDPPQGVSGKDYVFGFEDSSGAHVPGLLEQSDKLQQYAVDYPEEWNIVSHALGVSRQTSLHASAFIISDDSLDNIIPMMNTASANKVTQWEAKEVEKAGLIKYDFLCVSQLKDIGDCLNYINKKNNVEKIAGQFDHKGKDTYIWELPVDLPSYEAFFSGATETTFQTNTKSMLPFVKRIKPKSIIELATILALVRPGPLDFIDPITGRSMAEEYMWRREGRSKPDIPEMAELLPDTYGICVFQEDITKIGRDLGGMSGSEAEKLRANMSKKRQKALLMQKPIFMEGAVKKVSLETAEKIWDTMETFAKYGFSINHSVAYAMITYACVFLKHNYPLEWWAAVLSNAKDKEINENLWKHVKDKVAAPDINLSREHIVIDYDNGILRSKLSMITGLGEKAIKPIMDNRPYANLEEFVKKKVCNPAMTRKLIYIGVLDSLFEAKTPIMDKMQRYEDLIEDQAYINKIRSKSAFADEKVDVESFTANEVYEKIKDLKEYKRLAAPKAGGVDPKFFGLSSIEDFRMKKSILPSMPLNLLDVLIDNKHKKIIKNVKKSGWMPTSYYSINAMEKKTMILVGKELRVLDEKMLNGDQYFAAPCYVLEAKEFSYSGGKKKALKMIIDVDGYISEKVLWPNYNSGKLEYPDGLKKGALAILYYSKKEDKEYTNINDIYII